MPTLKPFQDELLSDDDHSWRQHVLWQSAALAPNEAADLELNKAVDQVGYSSHHFMDTLSAQLRSLFKAYCAVCTLLAGIVCMAPAGALLGLVEVDSQRQKLLQVLWLSLACMVALELPLLLVAARREADSCHLDCWFALDLGALFITALAWYSSWQQPIGQLEACAAILAMRFALQPLRAARSANAGGCRGGAGTTVRTLRSTERCSVGSALDTDLGFDNTSCCSSSQLRAERTLEAKLDSGFESSSCCSSSELKAERALEAKQASEQYDFEYDDIDSGWVCISCGTLNIGECSPQNRRHCDYCEASFADTGDL